MLKVAQSPANGLVAHSFEKCCLVGFLSLPNLPFDTVVAFWCVFFFFYLIFQVSVKVGQQHLRIRFFKTEHPPPWPFLFLKYSYFMKKFCYLCDVI